MYMAKKYYDFKIDGKTYQKYCMIKNLYQVQERRNFKHSEFINILLEKFSEKAMRQLKKQDAVLQSVAQ